MKFNIFKQTKLSENIFRITLQRNQKVPGEPTRVVAEARKRGKPNRAPAPQQHPPVVHHDAAVAQHSWESNMARIEAGIRQVNNRCKTFQNWKINKYFVGYDESP